MNVVKIVLKANLTILKHDFFAQYTYSWYQKKVENFFFFFGKHFEFSSESLLGMFLNEPS